MELILLVLTPAVDTLLPLAVEVSGEGDIPLWIATVYGDTILVSDGRHMYRFLAGDGKIYEMDEWASPVAFDDMVLWRGKLYALSRGNEKVYVFEKDEMIDSIPILYEYLSHFLYMFRTMRGIYLDMAGDSSYSILDGRPEPDPLFIRRKENSLIVEDGGGTFHLPEGVVSASFVGEDGKGRKYILMEKSSESGVEIGAGMLEGDRVRINWLGRFEMDGYIPRPLEVNGDGALFMFIPSGTGLRVIVWNSLK